MTATEPAIHTLLHQAMATEFRLRVVQADAGYARQAAQAAFRELDAIERRLSRFHEGSDVFRVGRLAVGRSTVVHPDTFDCLLVAEQIRCETGGLFDVAYATPAKGDGARFELDTRGLTVRPLVAGLTLDLGGIGKGFALDRMAALLQQWDIDAALLGASTSTLLARGAPPGTDGWAVHVGCQTSPRPMTLIERAVSASGTGVQGDHLIDPHSRRSAARYFRVWTTAPTAAVADALSTAFMLMSEPAIRDYCRRNPRVTAHLLDRPEGRMKQFGSDG